MRCLLATFLLAPIFLFAQEESSSPAEEPKIFRPEKSDPDWLEFYYVRPKPGEFIAQMEALSADGTLGNDGVKPVVIAFLSQLFRQNRKSLDGWYQELRKKLPKEDLQTIQTGMLFSRTEEADSILREQFGAQYEEQKRTLPKILELRLDRASTIDMLWGFYYASGSENAIRRLVMGFRFLEAPDAPEGVEVPEDHQPLYKMIPVFVGDSLISNGLRHPEIPKILDQLYREGDLNEIERREVGKVLEKIAEGNTSE